MWQDENFCTEYFVLILGQTSPYNVRAIEVISRPKVSCFTVLAFIDHMCLQSAKLITTTLFLE